MAEAGGVPKLSSGSTHAKHPHHRIMVDAHLGPLHLHANVELAASWTIIFGPSGSGKSTLLRGACGLLSDGTTEFSRHSSVSAAWLDIQTAHHSTPPQLRSIAYAPQGAVLFPHLSVYKNISFAADSIRQTSTQLAIEALTLFGLNSLANRFPGDLSGGERQRVNLARAFAVPSPTLFILDEPFAGIDSAARARLIPLIDQRIAQLGVPVLSVTHDVEEALLVHADVIRLDNGHVTAQGPAGQVLASERARMLRTLSMF